MARQQSTAAPRPSKPYPDFPLTPRADGRFCKRINGKIHYFVGTWQEALEEYNRVRDYLRLGKTPPLAEGDSSTLKFVCEEFLEAKLDLVESDELSKRSFDDYKGTCQRLLKQLGRNHAAAHVGPQDFANVRRALSRRLGPTALGNEINRIRSVFKFAYENGLIERPVIYGQGFNRPSQKTQRKHRAENGKKIFAADEIHKLVDVATPSMKSMIMLGINCGFGNSDCGQLEFANVNLDAGIIDFPRPKTGIDRRCVLWAETVEAMHDWLDKRPKPKDEQLKNRVFVTQRGLSFFKETPDNPIAKEFRKIAGKAGVYERGKTFYSLRHTFATQARQVGDDEAVRVILGHDDPSMLGAVYTHGFPVERLIRVSESVHEWMFGDEV